MKNKMKGNHRKEEDIIKKCLNNNNNNNNNPIPLKEIGNHNRIKMMDSNMCYLNLKEGTNIKNIKDIMIEELINLLYNINYN